MGGPYWMYDLATQADYAEPPVIADHCEQRGCQGAVETWCPLCERFLCGWHDELVLGHRHDCLSGPATTASMEL